MEISNKSFTWIIPVFTLILSSCTTTTIKNYKSISYKSSCYFKQGSCTRTGKNLLIKYDVKKTDTSGEYQLTGTATYNGPSSPATFETLEQLKGPIHFLEKNKVVKTIYFNVRGNLGDPIPFSKVFQSSHDISHAHIGTISLTYR